MEHRNELFDALMNGLPAADRTSVRKAIASTTVQKAEHISAQNVRELERERRRSAMRRQRPDSDGG